MQIIDISTLEFHISTTPNDTQSSKSQESTMIELGVSMEIESFGQFFESYLLHINITQLYTLMYQSKTN